MTAALGPPTGDPSGMDPVPFAGVAIDVSSVDYACTTDFIGGYCRELYVGVAGNITAQMVGDAAPLLYTAVPAGTSLSGKFKLVKHTGTTASAIVARF